MTKRRNININISITGRADEKTARIVENEALSFLRKDFNVKNPDKLHKRLKL